MGDARVMVFAPATQLTVTIEQQQGHLDAVQLLTERVELIPIEKAR